MKNHYNFDRDYLYIETIFIHLLLYLDCIDMQKYTYFEKNKTFDKSSQSYLIISALKETC